MKIVIDTNVLISGVFFGGFPRQILSSIVEKRITAFATTEIVDEYEEIVQEMISRKQGHINREILSPLIGALEIIESASNVQISRDPDDDKFINCAKDAHALYIVSGDKDLLVLKNTKTFRLSQQKNFVNNTLPNTKDATLCKVSISRILISFIMFLPSFFEKIIIIGSSGGYDYQLIFLFAIKIGGQWTRQDKYKQRTYKNNHAFRYAFV